MLVHKTKKLPVRSTSVGSTISYFHIKANRVDPDKAALTRKFKGVSMR